MTIRTEAERTAELDFCVLSEAIVGAFGLPEGRLHVSVRGDPSLRETAPIRERYQSRIDTLANEVLEVCEWLLAETGCYAVYVGFNSSELRTESVFNPLNYEIHDAEAVTEPGYVKRHFVQIPYEEKMACMVRLREYVHTGELQRYLPPHWRALMERERATWKPVPKEGIGRVMRSLKLLREVEGYYLRNAAVSLSQRMVRASFNCDGTYIVAAEFFPQFVRDNLP